MAHSLHACGHTGHAPDIIFPAPNVQDGISWWTWPIHVLMVSLGAFFIINLALAVLYLYFTKDKEERGCLC